MSSFYRILSLVAILFFSVWPAGSVWAGDSTTRPNILFIAVDDLNDWVTPLEGHPNTKTPNIDRLARAGVSFTNAHANAPLCGPSRASILTGMLPSTNGIYLHVNDKHIKRSNLASARAVFLTDWFELFGYKTMGAGKLSHGGDNADFFDEYGGFKSFGPKPESRMNYDPTWFDPKFKTSTDWGPFPEHDNQMPDHQLTDWIIERIAQKHDAPFFIGAGYNRPHVPWHVPQEWFDKFPLESLSMPPYKEGDLDDVPEFSRYVHNVPPTPTTEWAIEQGQWPKILQAYLASVAFVDHQIGRLLDALESSPNADNTIVVIWSDHGYHLGEKNRFAKMALWERATRIPLIIAGPGVSRDKTVAAPVSLVDLYPTLLELAGLPENEDNDGNSLVPLLRGHDSEWPHMALTMWGSGNTAVRSDRYRYIRYEDGSEELYDHATDPNEWHNLADDDALRAIKHDLRRHIPENPAKMSRVNFFEWNEYWRDKTRVAPASN